jgi:hypothetical protein
LEIEIQDSAGTTATLEDVMETFRPSSSGNTSPPTSNQWHGSFPVLGEVRQRRVADQ